MSHAETGLLDTSTLILLPRIRDSSVLPVRPLISVITLAELTVGPLVAQNEVERVARQAHLQQAEADFDRMGAHPQEDSLLMPVSARKTAGDLLEIPRGKDIGQSSDKRAQASASLQLFS